jgi:hypothetical protein
MFLCEDVITSAVDPASVTLVHLLAELQADSLPYVVPKLCVYVLMAGGRGSGVMRVVATEADSGRKIFGSKRHRIKHPADPLQALNYLVHIERCIFPRKGLYWIELRHDEHVIDEQPILIK